MHISHLRARGSSSIRKCVQIHSSKAHDLEWGFAMQISNAYVPRVADSTFGQAPLTQTCMDTCEAERDAEILPSAYGQTTCNDLLPTYPSSAAVFPCTAQRLPHSISQGFAIVFAPGPSSA